MMEPQNLAAVVVPVHNAGAFLLPCLQSIAAQTYANFYCVTVDDGSTDNSAALCADMAATDERFIPLTQQAAGAAAARAAGLAAAQQKGAMWITFCDADDLLHPAFLQTLLEAALSAKAQIACCRFDSFTVAAPAEAPAFTGMGLLLKPPAHLDALLHNHAVDYSLCNKMYRFDAIAPEMLRNDYAYNEDLLANWTIFSAANACVYCDWVGYHYRQHAQSASHRALTAQSIDEQRNAAAYIRAHAAPDMLESANAFYYEKLVYLASMILRQQDGSAFRVQLNEIAVGISAGLKDSNLGRNTRLPLKIKLAAFATVKAPALWQKFCRKHLTDRQ